MNLNSPHFDRIRAGSGAKAKPAIGGIVCDHPGCLGAGEFRAPMGRDREGQYFCFCLDHVRDYNAHYNYFNGMSDDAVARYQKDALVGHRPTWNMGVNRAAAPSDIGEADPLGIFRSRVRPTRAYEPAKPRHSVATLKALHTLGLDDKADAAAVKTRYKRLVKQLHPDANGGDRPSEDRLREIIRAYNFLKTVKLSDAAAAAR